MIRLIFAVTFVASTIAHADSRPPRTASFDPRLVYNVPRGAAPTTGPAGAPITIVEWSDYSCGYCGRVQDTLARLDLLYPGLLRYVHRALPIDTDNTIALELARVAHAQGRFRPMHGKLFAVHGRVDRARAEVIGRELGLDMMALRRDLDTGTHQESIAADLDAAARLGVSGTPTFFINGRPVLGSQPLAVFVDIVDEELARARKVAATNPPDLYEALVGRGRSAADTSASPGSDGVRPPLGISKGHSTPGEGVRRWIDPSPHALGGSAAHPGGAGVIDPQATYRVGLGLPGHQLGPDDALVTIVQWSDFQCPFCARLVPVWAHVRAKYGDHVRIVFRHMPLASHPSAALAAEAAVAAAAQGKFWPFHDHMFTRFGHVTRADLESFARAAALDMRAFRAALDDRRYRDAVMAEAASAAALGVDGTPTTFINGQPVVGARDIAAIDALIDAQVARARTAVARGEARADIYALAMAGARGEERADPSTIPDHTIGRLELRAEDRSRAAIAACRRRDHVRATKLAETLSGEVKARVMAVCTGAGIDLP